MSLSIRLTLLFALLAACGIPTLAAEPSRDFVLKELKDNRPAHRTQALRDALSLKPDAALVQALGAMLQDPVPQVRIAAAGALEHFGADASDAVPALAQLLQDRAPNPRAAAARALAKLGEPGMSGLLSALTSPRDDVRAAASQALPLCGDAAMPGLAEALKSESTETVAAALAALERMTTREAAVEPLFALLCHKQAGIRSCAAQALAKSGPGVMTQALNTLKNSRDATPELRAALTDVIGRSGAAAVPPLMELIESRANAPLLCSAIEALGKTGPAAARAVPLLIEFLETVPAQGVITGGKRAPAPAAGAAPYAKLDAAVLRALAGIGPHAAVALPLCFDLLKDGDATVRSEAARAISKIATGRERIPPLAETLERCEAAVLVTALWPFQDAGLATLLVEMEVPSLQARGRAAAVFANMPSASACPFLVKALRHEDARIRAGAALALGEIRRVNKNRGATAAGAVPNTEPVLAALRAAARDPNSDVRVLAAHAYMKAIDADNGELIELIATGLAGCSSDYRTRALAALDFYNLEKNARKAAPALPALVRLWGQDTGNTPPAHALIQRIGIGAEDIPALLGVLNEKSAYTRRTVCKLLEGLGPNARGAIGALIEALGDEDHPRNKATPVETALAAIGADALAPLFEALSDANVRRRSGAAATLGRMTLDDGQLRQLAALLGDERAELRAGALTALAPGAERAKFALPYLRDLLIEEDKAGFRSVQELLNVLDAAAIPALVDILRDQRAPVRAAAARALKPRKNSPQVLPSDALTPLLELLSDDNSEVKAAALQTLAVCADKKIAAQIVAALPMTMKDESAALRRAALLYLHERGAAAPKAALEALTLALKDETSAIRIAALEAIKTLGAEAQPAAPLLRAALADPERKIRAAAADALGALKLAADPETRTALNEMNALDALEQYARAQEEFFIRSWDERKVHYYAPTLKELTSLPRGVIAADVRDAGAPYNGYVFKMLDGQGATAQGGAKEHRADGKLTQGHALLAWPAEYPRSGRFTLICRDDGTVFRANLGPETERLCAAMRLLEPGEAWSELKLKLRDDGPARFRPKAPVAEDLEF